MLKDVETQVFADNRGRKQQIGNHVLESAPEQNPEAMQHLRQVPRLVPLV